MMLVNFTLTLLDMNNSTTEAHRALAIANLTKHITLDFSSASKNYNVGYTT
jgi:hypothetical protein